MGGSYPGQPLAVAAVGYLQSHSVSQRRLTEGALVLGGRHVDAGGREEGREGEQKRPSPWEVGSEGLTLGRCGSQLGEVAEGPSGSF